MPQILMGAANSAPWWPLLSELWNSLRALQWAAVISALVLTVGALLEYWKQLKQLVFLVRKWFFFRRVWPPIEGHVVKQLTIHALGPILVLLGIAGDFIFEGRAFILEDRQEEQNRKIIGSIKDRAEEAERKAKEAVTDSSIALSQAKDALSRAGEAEASLGKAESEAKSAQAASANALTTAGQARSEADSFEKDIASATRQAVGAESHLAEALKQAAAAQTELDRLRAPRLLTNVEALVSVLTAFKDTKFGFLGVYGDQESRDLAGSISEALQRAGWKPSFSPTTGRGMGLYFRMNNFNAGAIPSSIATGVHIGAVSQEKVEDLQKMAPIALPRHIRAALALKDALAASILPVQDDLASSSVDVEKFNDLEEVIIDVGNKPITKNSATHNSH